MDSIHTFQSDIVADDWGSAGHGWKIVGLSGAFMLRIQLFCCWFLDTCTILYQEWSSQFWWIFLVESIVFAVNLAPNGDGSKPWHLVNIKIAGKWMFIPLKMY